MAYRHHIPVLLICIGSSLPSVLSAQDAYLEGAAAFFASHCASGSGLPAENYLHYGGKLAKTISMLTPEQQARVFGSEAVSFHNAVNKAGKTNSSGATSESQEALPEEEQPTLIDRLITWLGG